MQWKPEYAIGIPEIDNQHRALIDFITEFEAAVAGKVHWNTVQPLIVRAREYVKFHFAVEESLMQIVNYPQFAAHRAEHLYVVKQFSALEQSVLRQDIKPVLVPMLCCWVIDHMIEADKPFGRYVQKAFAGLRSPEAAAASHAGERKNPVDVDQAQRSALS